MASRDLVTRAAGVFADPSQAIEQRPEAVKAAVAKLYPEVDAGLLDIPFAPEKAGWQARALTAADMAREMAFVKAGGSMLGGDRL